jgi:hypothetical protein
MKDRIQRSARDTQSHQSVLHGRSKHSPSYGDYAKDIEKVSEKFEISLLDDASGGGNLVGC